MADIHQEKTGMTICRVMRILSKICAGWRRTWSVGGGGRIPSLLNTKDLEVVLVVILFHGSKTSAAIIL